VDTSTIEAGFSKQNSWVAFLDVFEFTAMVKNVGYEKLGVKLEECHRKIFKLMQSRNDQSSLFIFSDSIFLSYSIADEQKRLEDLTKCIDYMRHILDIFVECELPLKGGLAFGPVLHGEKQLFGEPLVRAVMYGKMNNVPMVLLPMFELTEFQKTMQATRLPEPLDIELNNHGNVYSTYVVPNKLSNFKELAMKEYERYRIVGPYNVARAWRKTVRYIDGLIKKEAKRQSRVPHPLKSSPVRC